VIVPAGSVTEIGNTFVPVPDALVADNVISLEPLCVGVPLITPDDAFILNPSGKPAALKLAGLFDAVMIKLYATPILAGGMEVFEITGAAPTVLMLMVIILFPVPPAFVAVTVGVNVPAVVGVPLITPVPVLTFKPGGSPVAL
jgi:hypothetical protein